MSSNAKTFSIIGLIIGAIVIACLFGLLYIKSNAMKKSIEDNLNTSLNLSEDNNKFTCSGFIIGGFTCKNNYINLYDQYRLSNLVVEIKNISNKQLDVDIKADTNISINSLLMDLMELQNILKEDQFKINKDKFTSKDSFLDCTAATNLDSGKLSFKTNCALKELQMTYEANMDFNVDFDDKNLKSFFDFQNKINYNDMAITFNNINMSIKNENLKRFIMDSLERKIDIRDYKMFAIDFASSVAYAFELVNILEGNVQSIVNRFLSGENKGILLEVTQKDKNTPLDLQTLRYAPPFKYEVKEIQ